jgi:hypothetical protein
MPALPVTSDTAAQVAITHFYRPLPGQPDIDRALQDCRAAGHTVHAMAARGWQPARSLLPAPAAANTRPALQVFHDGAAVDLMPAPAAPTACRRVVCLHTAWPQLAWLARHWAPFVDDFACSDPLVLAGLRHAAPWIPAARIHLVTSGGLPASQLSSPPARPTANQPLRIGWVAPDRRHHPRPERLLALATALQATAQQWELRVVGDLPPKIARRMQAVPGITLLPPLRSAAARAEFAAWHAMVVTASWPVFQPAAWQCLAHGVPVFLPDVAEQSAVHDLPLVVCYPAFDMAALTAKLLDSTPAAANLPSTDHPLLSYNSLSWPSLASILFSRPARNYRPPARLWRNLPAALYARLGRLLAVGC